MALDNPRVRARRELEELGLSMESVSYLVDDRPPGGWESLATHEHLLVTKSELRSEMADLRAEFQRELRAQTRWLTNVLLVALTIVSTIAGGVAGVVVRFL